MSGLDLGSGLSTDAGEEGWLMGRAGSGRGPRGFTDALRAERVDSVALLRLELAVAVDEAEDQEVRLELDSAGETGLASVSTSSCSSSKSCALSSSTRSSEESSEQMEEVDQMEAGREW